VIAEIGWFVLGAATGWLHTFSQRQIVQKLGVNNSTSFVGWFALRMLLFWVAAAILLVFSLRSGLSNGLAVFAGLLLARWVSLVYYVRRS
jgi:hypothetical protein